MSKHKFTKVGESLFYKEGIYEYRGAKIWCESKLVKNPYGCWRSQLRITIDGESRILSATANTRKRVAQFIDSDLEKFGLEAGEGFKVY